MKTKQRRVNKQATKKETRKVIRRAQKSVAPTKTKGKKDGKVVKNYDAQKAEAEGALTKEERAKLRTKNKTERRKRRRLLAGKAPKPSQAEAYELAKEALARIYEALSGEKDVMSNGTPWVPNDWEERYKRALGSYKQFLRGQPSIKIIEGDVPEKWIFKRTLDAAGIENSDIASLPFQRALRDAWTAYVMEKKHKNLNLEQFFGVMPNSFKGMFFENYESEGARKVRLARELAAREAEAAQKALFDKIDTNHDGVISPEEFAAAQKTGQIGQVTCP